MGWISDAINNAVSWLVDKIFKPFMTWVINVIETIIAELRIMRHQLVADFAKWLSNDFAFLLTVIAAIALGIFWPKIYLYLKDMTEKFLTSAIIQSIRDGITSITDSMFWINVETLHLILRTLWPDYKAMMGDFAQAVAALADELGEGSGYILAYFQLQNAIAHNTGAILGLDPKASELESYNKIAEFTKRIDDRFRRYAYDPGLIYTDFLEEIVIPSSTDMKDAQQALVTEVREQHERNVEMDAAITGIETAVDRFIDEMPDEIAEQIEKRWEPIKAWMESNYHYLVDEFLEITNELSRIMELRQDRIEESNAYAIEKLDDPMLPINAYMMGDKEEQEALRDYYIDMVGLAMIEAGKEQAVISRPVYDETFSIITNLARSLPGPVVLSFEPPGFASIPRGSGKKESWFIGEY